MSTLLVLPAVLMFFAISDLALIIFGLVSQILGFLLIMFRWDKNTKRRRDVQGVPKNRILRALLGDQIFGVMCPKVV